MKADQQLPGDGDEGGSDGEKELQRDAQKPFNVIDMFTLLIVRMVSWGYLYVKSHEIAQVKHVPFTVWQLHLNKVDRKTKPKKKCSTLHLTA